VEEEGEWAVEDWVLVVSAYARNVDTGCHIRVVNLATIRHARNVAPV